jgi:hypothetical protein
MVVLHVPGPGFGRPWIRCAWWGYPCVPLSVASGAVLADHTLSVFRQPASLAPVISRAPGEAN